MVLAHDNGAVCNNPNNSRRCGACSESSSAWWRDGNRHSHSEVVLVSMGNIREHE